MTTGPIERYPHFRPQIHKSRRFSYTRCAGGAFRMLWGYTKKDGPGGQHEPVHQDGVRYPC